MPFHFSAVFVRDRRFSEVAESLVELMAESEHLPVRERGLEPTPDDLTSAKPIRSFALMPDEDHWITVLEDGHPLDDGGVAEGMSDLLQTEALHFTYSDHDGFWSFESYWEGQPLESGGSDDEAFDVAALQFVAARSLPHFGVYYEEVAAAAGESQPALAGALGVFGNIVPRVPMGTEILTFRRPGKPLPE